MRYSQLAADKNKNDLACSQKLNEGLKVVQKLVSDLEQVRTSNDEVERDQVSLMTQLSQLTAENASLD